MAASEPGLSEYKLAQRLGFSRKVIARVLAQDESELPIGAADDSSLSVSGDARSAEPRSDNDTSGAPSSERVIGNTNRRGASDPRDAIRRAALAAMPVRMRIRRLVRLARSKDEQVALRALAMLNDLSWEKDGPSAPDMRPMFELPAQAAVAVAVTPIED